MMKVLRRSLSLCETKYIIVVSENKNSTTFTRPAYEVDIKDLHPSTLEQLHSIQYPYVVNKEEDIIEIDRWYTKAQQSCTSVRSPIFTNHSKSKTSYSITNNSETKIYEYWEYRRLKDGCPRMEWFLIDKIPDIKNISFHLRKEWVIKGDDERINYKPIVLEKCTRVEDVKW